MRKHNSIKSCAGAKGKTFEDICVSLAGQVGMSQRSLAISISSRSLTGNRNVVRNDDVKLATIPGVLWFAKARSTRLYMILAFICAICSGAVVPGESERFSFKWISLHEFGRVNNF